MWSSGAGTEAVPAHLPAFRRQVAEELQTIINQLPGAVLDEHMTGKLSSFKTDWEPPCLLATPRLRKLVFRLLQYEVCASRLNYSGFHKESLMQATCMTQILCCPLRLVIRFCIPIYSQATVAPASDPSPMACTWQTKMPWS